MHANTHILLHTHTHTPSEYYAYISLPVFSLRIELPQGDQTSACLTQCYCILEVVIHWTHAVEQRSHSHPSILRSFQICRAFYFILNFTQSTIAQKHTKGHTLCKLDPSRFDMCCFDGWLKWES